MAATRDDGDRLVGITLRHGVATLTLDRSDARNALNLQMKQDLIAALDRIAGGSGVRAVLLRAEGPAFCVGQDLGEHAAALEHDASSALGTVREHYNRIVATIAGLPVPVVVAIRGACVGAGLGFALAGDVRVAAEDARFATAFAGIGLASDSGLARALARSIGVSRATALLLLGEPFDAAQAHAWGLVHTVAPIGDLERVAGEIVARLAEGPTQAYARIKALLRDVTNQDLEQALEREADAQEALARTADHRAAVAAFLAKRRPWFTGA